MGNKVVVLLSSGIGSIMLNEKGSQTFKFKTVDEEVMMILT